MSIYILSIQNFHIMIMIMIQLILLFNKLNFISQRFDATIGQNIGQTAKQPFLIDFSFEIPGV